MIHSRFPCLWLGCGAPLEEAVCRGAASCPVGGRTEAVPAERPIVPPDPASPATARRRRRGKASKPRQSETLACEQCSRRFTRKGRFGPRPRFCSSRCQRLSREDQLWCSATVGLEEQHRAEFPNGSGE
jgi:hypothetical protein